MLKLRIAVNSFKRECAHGNYHAFTWFLTRFYFRYIRRILPLLPQPTRQDKERPLSVVIPAVKKDADILVHCLQAARRHIQNPIQEIMVVAPDCPVIRSIADEWEAQWMNEDSILPMTASTLKTRGWVLQQLIKFSAALYVSAKDYLVLDADTVFLRPQFFFRNGKTMLRYSDQYELLYNRSLELIFRNCRRFPVSFVTHHMVFNVNLVTELKKFIERQFKTTWWEAILSDVDKGHKISFSEYEIYGHYVLMNPHWGHHFQLEYWAGLDLDLRYIQRLNGFSKERWDGFNSVSFHSHTQ
jgi:hypothetical protein